MRPARRAIRGSIIGIGTDTTFVARSAVWWVQASASRKWILELQWHGKGFISSEGHVMNFDESTMLKFRRALSNGLKDAIDKLRKTTLELGSHIGRLNRDTLLQVKQK